MRFPLNGIPFECNSHCMKMRYSIESREPELHSNESNNQIPKERYISPQERQKIIDELRLI